ncbi:isoprenyl transferase [Portibacter lacus]|uniref:Isoprenyl transferase n=2 Tax=Portibacter lacus TaxID=1099794 RepID=A0AA37WFI1_9BACT|nr:isoprenyl transferase [Portibacter lacus]
MDLKSQINMDLLPEHIAIIMDGNGRWAKKYGKPRVFGHRNGVKAVRESSESCAELGIKYLTLYAFSTENWNRPKLEVNALMALLVETLRKEVETLNKNNIRLNAIGDLTKLPPKSYKALLECIENTKHNDRMTLTLALNYSSRWEILHATKLIAEDVKSGKVDPDQIDDDLFKTYLDTHNMPDPELMIRTSGEKRISNYLLYQMAYSELYFTDIYWPDFRREDLYKAIVDYQQRERRFGKTSEQLG